MTTFFLTWPTTWIAETLFASTLLIAAVLVLRGPAARLLGPHAAYMLWTVPLLRLVLPPVPGAAIVSLPMADATVFAPPSTADVFPAPEIAAAAWQPPVALAPSFDWVIALLVAWLAGAAIHMTWHVVRYRRFIGAAVGGEAPAHAVGGIFVHNADVAGPAAAGIVRRRILLPYDFTDRFGPRERRLALAHEVAHHRRGDLLANWVALAFLSVHWFNPLAHIAYRAFRADQELACDATVLRAASLAERHAYASAVVKAAWDRSPVAACPMNSSSHLKARLAMMKAGGVRHPLAGVLAVAVVAIAALGVTASRVAGDPPPHDVGPPARATVEGPRAAPSSLARAGDESASTAVASEAARAPVANIKAASRDAVAPDAGASEGRAPDMPLTPHLAGVEDGRTAPPARALEPVIEPALPSVALVQAVSRASADDHLAGRPALAVTPASFTAMPSPEALKASAAEARRGLGLASRGVVAVRDTRAVMVPGQFNAADPGTPFVGFCGSLLLAGETRWLPFFTSATDSKPGREAKCSGPQSAEDYSSDLQPSPARRAAARSKDRNLCTADKSTCTQPFARLAPLNGPIMSGVVPMRDIR